MKPVGSEQSLGSIIDAQQTMGADEKKVLDMMTKMQKQAETEANNPEYNSGVNSPKTVYKDSKPDNANYWDLTNELPSKGILYPDGVLIEARSLKVIEVKKLASITGENADYVINDIVRRCVRVQGLAGTEELFLADKIYLVLWMRAVTYRDSSYTVGFTCPKCEAKSNYHFAVKNLEINYLKDDYDPNTKMVLENGGYIRLRHLKIKDESAIERFLNVNKKVLGEIDIELLALACMIIDIDGDTGKQLIEKYNFVLDLTPRDLSQITTYVENHTIGIEENMTVDCDKCGGNVPLGITFRSNFFLPKYTAR